MRARGRRNRTEITAMPQSARAQVAGQMQTRASSMPACDAVECGQAGCWMSFPCDCADGPDTEADLGQTANTDRQTPSNTEGGAEPWWAPAQQTVAPKSCDGCFEEFGEGEKPPFTWRNHTMHPCLSCKLALQKQLASQAEDARTRNRQVMGRGHWTDQRRGKAGTTDRDPAATDAIAGGGARRKTGRHASGSHTGHVGRYVGLGIRAQPNTLLAS